MAGDNLSPPVSPILHPETPATPGPNAGYFSVPFEKFMRDDIADWASGFTLMDTMETYFDSRLDLLQRRLAKHSEKLKLKAEEKFQDVLRRDIFKTKSPSGDRAIEREMQTLKLKMTQRMTSLTATWQSAKIVRTREKITFFSAVMSLFFTTLVFAMAPEYIHILYTAQALYLLPLRVYRYKKRAWHYFLFDLCYYTTILDFIFIWFMPSSPALWVACYCLSHGSVASAVITWRNSLVFHDHDKVTSLFIHIYPPLTFTVIRHFYPNAEVRFPALKQVPHLEPIRALVLSSIIYSIWQLLYWKFVLINRRTKVESGQRMTSFYYLLNDKRGVIGKALAAIPPSYREVSFMVGQLIYSILTELPAVFLLYGSPLWSEAFMFLIFAVSVWNGGGFYIEVFGRKFERELEALRKELAEATASRSENSSPILLPQSDDGLSTVANSPEFLPDSAKSLPTVTSNLHLDSLPLDTKKDQ